MQDFFCPKCGRRMLDGKCAHCEGAANRRGAPKRPGSAPAQTRRKSAAPGPALTEEKIIPFDSISADGAAGQKSRKEEIVVTLVERDERKEREEAIARNTPWKAKGLKPLKRVSLFLSHCVAKFTAFVDRLVNPGDE